MHLKLGAQTGKQTDRQTGQAARIKADLGLASKTEDTAAAAALQAKPASPSAKQTSRERKCKEREREREIGCRTKLQAEKRREE